MLPVLLSFRFSSNIWLMILYWLLLFRLMLHLVSNVLGSNSQNSYLPIVVSHQHPLDLYMPGIVWKSYHTTGWIFLSFSKSSEWVRAFLLQPLYSKYHKHLGSKCNRSQLLSHIPPCRHDSLVVGFPLTSCSGCWY